MVTLERVDVVDAQPYVGRSCREAVETLSAEDVMMATRTTNKGIWCRGDMKVVPDW